MDVINFIEVKVKNYLDTKRPDDPGTYEQYSFAKAKYIASKNLWKVYWKKSNGQWSIYHPAHEVSTVDTFIEAIEKDEMACFWE